MRRLDESEIFRKNTWFHLNYNCIEQILYSLRRICEPCKEYVDNSFSPLGKEYVEELNKVKEMTNWAIDATNIVIYSSDYKEHEIVMDRIKRREDELMNISIEQMNRIQKKHENIDLSVLYLNIKPAFKSLIYNIDFFLLKHFFTFFLLYFGVTIWYNNL